MNNSFQKPPLAQLPTDFGPVTIMYDSAVYIPQKKRFEILPQQEFKTLEAAAKFALSSPNFQRTYLTHTVPESGILWSWEQKELEQVCKQLAVEVLV